MYEVKKRNQLIFITGIAQNNPADFPDFIK